MNLHQQFVKLGQEHRAIIYKIQAILPQIYKEGIYQKYAIDIYEYARKYAGLNSGVVAKILKTANKLEDKPNLLAAIETAGIHKVALIANVATSENENDLADAIKNMSKSAVMQLSKDLRQQQTKHSANIIKIELDEEMQFLFNQIKQKGVSNKEALRKILLKLHQDIKPTKIKSVPGKIPTNRLEFLLQLKPISRYIRAATKHQIPKKCAFEHCTKPRDHIHHIKPFSESKNNHISNLMPLCKEHHEIIHTYRTKFNATCAPTPPTLCASPS